jgi:hypothetical protein
MLSPCVHTLEPARGLTGAGLDAELSAAEQRCGAASGYALSRRSIEVHGLCAGCRG